MQIIVVEGVPYHWVKQLQEIHAHVFEGAQLTLEKLESKKRPALFICLGERGDSRF